jgi:hypothetical protein
VSGIVWADGTIDGGSNMTLADMRAAILALPSDVTDAVSVDAAPSTTG